jgi:hypothetical protein
MGRASHWRYLALSESMHCVYRPCDGSDVVEMVFSSSDREIRALDDALATLALVCGVSACPCISPLTIELGRISCMTTVIGLREWPVVC